MHQWQKGLSDPVANESVVLMIMQTLRHFHPSPRGLHLRKIRRFSLPPARFGVLFGCDGIISFDGIIMRELLL
jgi:hypothetical protein